MYVGEGVLYVHRGGGIPYVHGACSVTDLSALRDPYPAKNGPKRSPKFCRRSEFERIIEKSQIFFKFRADFRKKVCKKGGQKGVFGWFGGFFPVLPYFPCFTLFWVTSWGVVTKSGIKGKAARLKAAQRWDGD